MVGDWRLESVLSWKEKGTRLLREVEAFLLGFLVGVGIWTSDLEESLGCCCYSEYGSCRSNTQELQRK